MALDEYSQDFLECGRKGGGDTPMDGQSLVGNQHSPTPESARSASTKLDLFLFNDKNRAFLEGEKRAKPAALSRWSRWDFLVVLLITAGIYLLSDYVYGFEGSKPLLLQISSETTIGVISDFRTAYVVRSGKDGGSYTDYLVICHYAVRGQEYTNEVSVSESEYYGLRPGSRVEVTYFPWHPRISRVSGLEAGRSRFLDFLRLFLVGDLITVLMYEAYRRRRFRRHGQLLIGILIAWSARKAFLKEATWNVRAKYRFSAPDGQTIDGTKRVTTTHQEFAVNRVGKSVAVLYLSKRAYDVL
jgi:hypothetical protein